MLKKNIYVCNGKGLYEKNAFKCDLRLWEVPNQENLQFHFHVFSSPGTSCGKKSLLKAYFL